jgi:hypothetical protein
MAIPEYCKAGVVVNEGPNFSMAVQQVKVPSPGMCSPFVTETPQISYGRNRIEEALQTL